MLLRSCQWSKKTEIEAIRKYRLLSKTTLLLMRREHKKSLTLKFNVFEIPPLFLI